MKEQKQQDNPWKNKITQLKTFSGSFSYGGPKESQPFRRSGIHDHRVSSNSWGERQEWHNSSCDIVKKARQRRIIAELKLTGAKVHITDKALLLRSRWLLSFRKLVLLRQTEVCYLQQASSGKNLRKVTNTQKRRGSQKSVFGLTHPVLFSAAILKARHYICGWVFS